MPVESDEMPGAVEIGSDGKPLPAPVKRKPGRPPGAKNKPKVAVIPTAPIQPVAASVPVPAPPVIPAAHIPPAAVPAPQPQPAPVPQPPAPAVLPSAAPAAPQKTLHQRRRG